MTLQAKLISLTLPWLLLLHTDQALAGPGGMIAKAVWNSTWGKILIGLLVLFFLPLILLSLIAEHRAVRRSRRDLRFMAKHSELFEWLSLRERAQDCFYQLHVAWARQDLQLAEAHISDWYRQNQQAVYLDRWQRKGLVNHCDIKRISQIKPVLFVHRNVEAAHQHSLLVLSITARQQDYLLEKKSGQIVEGDKRYKEVETIWTLRLEDQQWRVNNIEEASCLFDYVSQRKGLPAIEQTVRNRLEA